MGRFRSDTARIIPWRKKLAPLIPTLRRRLECDRERRIIAELSGGASVELCFREDGREEVRISRTTAPSDARGLKAWNDELATFRKHLKLERWTYFAVPVKTGIAVGFLSPAPVEAAAPSLLT